MDGEQAGTRDAGVATEAPRAASPNAVAQPNTAPVINHYASLIAALLDSVRGFMSSYRVATPQVSPLDEATDWRSLRLSLRSHFGSASGAFVADAASVYTGTLHRPKERAAQVIAAMERIGPAKLAEGCIELETEAFAGTGSSQAKSAGRQAWYGAAEAISWLYAVRSAFLWDGSSDISPGQPTNSLPTQAAARPAPFGFPSSPTQQPPAGPLASGFAPPPAPGLIAKQQEEKKMRLAASVAQSHPAPVAAPSRPTFWPTPSAPLSSAAAPMPAAPNPSPQPFATQTPAACPAPFAQPSAAPSTSKAAVFASAMSALSNASSASTSAAAVPPPAPAPTPAAASAPSVAPASAAPPVPVATSSARASPAPAPGSSHSTPAPIFETPPVLPTGPPSAGFAPPPPPSAASPSAAAVDVKPKIRKQRASTGGIGTKKGKAKGDDDDAGYMPAGASKRAAENGGGRAGSERPQRKRKVPLRLQGESEDLGGEYDSWEEGWGSYLEERGGVEKKKKRRRTFSGFDDPSDDDDDFDETEPEVEEFDELGSDYEEQLARKKAKKAKTAAGGGGGRGGRKRGSLAGNGLTEQEQAEEDERLLNDPDRFKIGQAVMAKFPNYNFWPSVVLDHRNPPAKTQGKRTPGAYLVKSVPTGGDHRWVAPDDSSIVPLTSTQLDDIILARYKSAPPTSWSKWRGELVDAALLIKDPEKLKEWLSRPTPAELYQLEHEEKKRAKRMSAFY